MLDGEALYALHRKVLPTLSVVKDPRPEPEDFTKLPALRQMYFHNLAALIREYVPVTRYAVVTPWLDHGREWYIRFVGTLTQCTEHHAENYGIDSTYASVTALPDNGTPYRAGHIIPKE